MNILAFDTCLEKMYVSLANDEKILESKIIETTKSHYHSAFLISTIKDILKENGLEPKDINVIATNVGPGSFTGIRACTTVARVFAQAVGCKVVGVSSLEILSRLNPDLKKQTLVALDARKEMAYVAIYENKKEIFAPKAVLIEELKNDILNNEAQFVVTDYKLRPILNGISYQETKENLGDFLVEIAQERFTNGLTIAWKELHPLYIQPPPVTTQKK